MREENRISMLLSHLRLQLGGRKAQRIKLLVLGQNTNDGLAAKLFVYYILSIVAYLYLQPFFYMISTMLKPLSDLLDPTVNWIPRQLTFDNIKMAIDGLQYSDALFNTFTIASIGSVIQVFVCAITGYALARLKFPGKSIVFVLVFLTFLIPPQIIIIPLYIIFSKLGWLNTPYVFLVPALFGQGVKSALFIIIFSQFFRTLPKALEEAAQIDGASIYRMFFRIILPLARPACLVVFLFSFIWYWNEHYLSSMFLTQEFIPLSTRLNNLETVLYGENAAAMAQNPVTEGTKMGGAFLIVFPPLLIYMVAQKWFVEGIERTGLVE